MSNRGKAFDAVEGVILDEENSGVHLSSGLTPSDSGLKGDRFFSKGDSFILQSDGSDWVWTGPFQFSYHTVDFDLRIKNGQHMLVWGYVEVSDTGCLLIDSQSALLVLRS